MHYSSGANLGGWLVHEAWLLPNILLTRLGGGSIKDNQEYDYIQRMCERGIDAVQSMRRHWASFLGEDDGYDLLKATSPPPLLTRLRAHGVTVLRIPVGYWMFEPPATRGCPSAWPPVPEPALNRSRHGSILRSLSEEGVTADGFVTGNAPHLAALLSLLKPLGMRAVIDMHSLPGGAVRRMGYTGKFFEETHAIDGADAWFAAMDSSGVAGPPPAAFPFLCRSAPAREAAAVKRGVAAPLGSDA